MVATDALWAASNTGDAKSEAEKVAAAAIADPTAVSCTETRGEPCADTARASMRLRLSYRMHGLCPLKPGALRFPQLFHKVHCHPDYGCCAPSSSTFLEGQFLVQ